MKIGVMGGTFDPIHLGHLRAAEIAREAQGLDKVLFVPAGVPPHRERPRSSALDRFAMVCLATHAQAEFAVSDLELRSLGPHYTVDTLGALAQENAGAELYLIVGSDTYQEIDTWRDHTRLRALCRLVVVSRPEAHARLCSVEDPWVCVVAGESLPISATLVRHSVAQGLSIRYLVPDGVADHVAKRGLYR